MESSRILRGFGHVLIRLEFYEDLNLMLIESDAHRANRSFFDWDVKLGAVICERFKSVFVLKAKN